MQQGYKKQLRLMIIGFSILAIMNIAMADFARASNNPTPVSASTTEQFQLENGATRYYVTTLNASQTWTLNCTALFKGVFHLFLFDDRPEADFLTRTGNYSTEIFNASIAYNITPIEVFSDLLNDTTSFISLNYTAPRKAMYYLQIILVENGPDTFILESSASQLQAYFIPYIPGYSISWIGVGIVIVIGFKLRKRKQK